MHRQYESVKDQDPVVGAPQSGLDLGYENTVHDEHLYVCVFYIA